MTVTEAIERLREIARECDTLAYELQHEGGDARNVPTGSQRNSLDGPADLTRRSRGKKPALPEHTQAVAGPMGTPGKQSGAGPTQDWSAFEEFHQWWLSQGGGWDEQMAAQLWISRGFTDPEKYRKLKASWSTWNGHVGTWMAHNWLARWAPENRPPAPVPTKSNGRARTVSADELRQQGLCLKCGRLHRYCECGKVAV